MIKPQGGLFRSQVRKPLPSLKLVLLSMVVFLFDLVSPKSQVLVGAEQNLGSQESSDSPEVETAAGPLFSIPTEGRLKDQTHFWIGIYTKYTTSQGILHDSKYVNLVYEVMDLSQEVASGRPAWKSKRVAAQKRKWTETLRQIAKKAGKVEPLTTEEELLVGNLKNAGLDPGDKKLLTELLGRKRIRLQLGQKDRFLDGIIQSGRYLKKMEEIFEFEGIPKEITRLPFVESSFNLKARSKVGASGIWQFMRGTGKLFLHIHPAIDERNDPIRATEAAARLMRVNLQRLGSWPLAISAYNHGTEGIARAQRNTKSDQLEEIIGEYRSRRFGFASANFYTEFLAAVEVEKNAEKYFGKIERQPALPTQEVTLPQAIKLKTLVQFLQLDEALLKELNPGITSLALTSRTPLPAGLKLRYPIESADFLVQFDAIPKKEKSAYPVLKEKRYGSKPQVENSAGSG